MFYMDKLVSVIIPVYNVEKYIEKCLESVLNQSYKKLEILIINDGSKDKSEEKYKKYLKDKRIKVIKQKNEGLSSARNTGIINSSGDYIMFVDSDDWIDKNCIEYCLKELLEDDYEVIIFPYISEYRNKSIVRNLFVEEKKFEEKKIKEDLLSKLLGKDNNPLTLENLNTAWGKLYKKRIISEIKFLDTSEIGTEDCLFNINVFYFSKKIKYINECYYHYRKDNIDSLTKTYKKELFSRWCRLYYEMSNFIDNKKLDESYKKNLNNRVILNIFSLLLNISDSNLKLKDKYFEIKILLNQKIYRESFEKFESKEMNLIWKIYYFLCKNKQNLIILCSMELIKKLRGNK